MRARLLELGEREAARDTEAAFVGTFHGFCARLLRAHPLLAGLDPEFAVLDEGARTAAARAAPSRRRCAPSSDARAASAAVDLLAAYGSRSSAAMVLGVHAELRSRGDAPAAAACAARAAGRPTGDDAKAAAACELLDELLERLRRTLRALKRPRGAVDFDDLELLARRAPARAASGIRAAWAERFELLMVDEFQDTNPRQLAILQALDRGNLFTVGDELQSIYGFRHADVELFRERRAELARAGGSLALTRNFRSRAALLDVVNASSPSASASATASLQARRDGERPRRRAADVELLLTARTAGRPTTSCERASRSGPAGGTRVAPGRGAAARPARRRAGARRRSARRARWWCCCARAATSRCLERALQLRGLRTLAAVGGFWGSQQVARPARLPARARQPAR